MSSQIRENLQRFFVLGISYKKTSIETRERFSLSDSAQEAILHKSKERGIESIVVLSTCNRTEIYAHTSDVQAIKELFLEQCRVSMRELECNSYELKGHECLEHLFRVAAGLDSQIIGDFQIVGQVKIAYQISEKLGLINSFMNRLFSFVFKASKQIKNTTGISKGAASVSHAAVQYIKESVDDLEKTNFLLFGTGEIGKDTVENLLKHMNNRSLTLVNRTKAKAMDLAERYSVDFLDADELSKGVTSANVIVVATGASEPTLRSEHFKACSTEKVVLDLSVPRNVAADVEQNPLVRVITVDELSQFVSKAVEERKKCLPDAECIIREALEEFYGWMEVKFLSPVIVALKENLEKIQAKEIDYHRNKLTEEELKKVEHITTNIVNKISRACINHLKDHHKKQSSPIETLNMIFKDSEA